MQARLQWVLTRMHALASGRHIDCACDYGNEAEVGDAIQRAIGEGICTREVNVMLCVLRRRMQQSIALLTAKCSVMLCK